MADYFRSAILVNYVEFPYDLRIEYRVHRLP